MANDAARILKDITASNFKIRTHPDKVRIFNDFAHHFGWKPSDYLEAKYGLGQKSNGHLIVEHGLEHAAVISFIAEPTQTSEIPPHEIRSLLSISYNNLVNLHITIDQYCVYKYSNRIDPPKPEFWTLRSPDFSVLTAKQFYSEMEKTENANLPALDTVLIETIDYWKRFLHDEIKCKNKNEAISALFNAIIFVRAVEDHYHTTNANSSISLLERWCKKSSQKELRTILLEALRSYKAGRGASSLLTLDRLEPFEKLDGSIIESLIKDFYKVKRTPYEYNFALMSRHALSRIYEKYVALLRQEKRPNKKERTLFPINLPEAERNKAAGAIYTPQFIPRFFCRFIEDRIPPLAFRELKIADPACGSGIFLRTFLERKTERIDLTTRDINKCFKNILGLDIDENACQACKLSLALLQLMRTNKLPSRPKVLNEELIAFFEEHGKLKEHFGAVIGNPPFVRSELQSRELHRRIKRVLSGVYSGKPDLYLAILRVAMKMIEPSGFLGFVLPHSFLVNRGPKSIRKELKKQFWLRCVVDLSAIRIFEDFSAYIILIIAQKKARSDETAPACRIVRCQDFIGHALQDCLDNKTTRTPYYSVFDVDQEYFGEHPWILLGPDETILERKLLAMPNINDFLKVREGVITGCDKVFIISSEKVPSGEEHLYTKFLPDRDIEKYFVPASTKKFLYYPYSNGKRITEKELRKAKKTWDYLNNHKKNLPVNAANSWPYILRGREKELLQPKIISPHLVLSPRFSLDVKGKYTISHAPFLVPRERDDDLEMLKFFTGVLNSSVVHWYLGTHAYRFSRGYVKLDPIYLRGVPVPDPSKVSPLLFKKIVNLVDTRIKTRKMNLDIEIDKLVLEAYGLTAAERKIVGAEEL